MPRENSNSARPGQTRRQFLKKTGAGTLAVAGAGLFQFPFSTRAEQRSPALALVLDATDPLTKTAPVQWAAEQLQSALATRHFSVLVHPSLDTVSPGETAILAGSGNSLPTRQVFDAARISLPDSPECLALARSKIQNRSVILAAGSDERGLVYALLELAERVQFAGDPLSMLKALPPVSERPANRIRSISRSFVSDVEDKAWFNDRDFWPPYLTMLAASRFNRFNLALGIGYDFTTGIRDCYFHFAYPFLLAVPGYNVRANPLPDAERDRNLEMLRFISDETARRGLHFQLGLWTHAYEWAQSPNANYLIEGLTPATHALYCRDALRALLTACPSISGVTFRIHGESGVPEGNYDLWKTIFDGAAQCGRRVEIDMHAKGMDQGMIDTALGTGLPVNISPKFWAEHMGLPYMQGAIRPLEMPPRNARTTGAFKLSSGARQFLRYGYGDLLTEDRRYGVLHRIWPGTQRLLLWGDPQTAAGYGRVAGFCGSSGLELFEPLFFKGRKGSGLPGGRDGYADLSLRAAGGDFEKYRYTYCLWGRSLYNPDGDPEAWRRLLRHQFGRGAEKVESALASASRILPLVTTAHCPSAANYTYWPEIYTHMPIVNENRPHPYGDTPTPRRLGTVSPLDPEFFLGIDEFAKELLTPPNGSRTGKYSPAWVAQQLDEFAANASASLREAKSKVSNPRSADFRRLAADVTLQAGLGRFFAAKFRAGMLLALLNLTADRAALVEALKANRAARAIWAELAAQAKEFYRQDLTFGYDKSVRGHWLDRLPAMDQDIADMERLPETQTYTILDADPKAADKAIREILSPTLRADAARLAGFHTPPNSFIRSQPFAVTASLAGVKKAPKLANVRLRYRRVNQAETWQSVEMTMSKANYHAEIPAAYADSPSRSNITSRWSRSPACPNFSPASTPASKASLISLPAKPPEHAKPAKNMRSPPPFVLALLSTFVALGLVAQTNTAITPLQRTELFNGKDFTGFAFCMTKNADPMQTWSVTNGVIHCTGQPTGYIRTTQEYRDYALTVEWRFLKIAPKLDNSGVLLHMQKPDKVWPTCIQVQGKHENQGDLFLMAGAESKEHRGQDANTALPKRGPSNENPVGQWDTVVSICSGDKVTAYVNGKLMNETTQCTITGGFIGIQSEGGDMEIRKMTLEPLPGPAKP